MSCLALKKTIGEIRETEEERLGKQVNNPILYIVINEASYRKKKEKRHTMCGECGTKFNSELNFLFLHKSQLDNFLLRPSLLLFFKCRNFLIANSSF
ncbi:hypothetical protein RclHR1_01160012 [Rhizophagus clarus]|uniref:Uncharacterized protein n=1 Tax=Rhizophagus clarus TaxID=94130 RepID=A0A2Z6QWH3_9GLOM|nr:hypothetical protein RclHR1_01160012 [Rhizophagus clarus]